MKAKQKLVINDMADLDLSYRTLKQKKINIKNNVKPTQSQDAMAEVDEYEELRKRVENFDRICTNKQIKQIDKVLAKESTF